MEKTKVILRMCVECKVLVGCYKNTLQFECIICEERCLQYHDNKSRDPKDISHGLCDKCFKVAMAKVPRKKTSPGA